MFPYARAVAARKVQRTHNLMLYFCADCLIMIICGKIPLPPQLPGTGGCTMAKQFIPDDVAQFILDKIESVAHLEALLILRREPEKEWSAPSLAARLYISEEQTGDLLISLRLQGFVIAKNNPSLFQYRPATIELHQMLDRLADIYAKHLVPVTHLIHSKPKPRIQEFADAFRLRKDK